MRLTAFGLLTLAFVFNAIVLGRQIGLWRQNHAMTALSTMRQTFAGQQLLGIALTELLLFIALVIFIESSQLL